MIRVIILFSISSFLCFGIIQIKGQSVPDSIVHVDSNITQSKKLNQERKIESKKLFENKKRTTDYKGEIIFYWILLVLFFYGLIKTLYSKYIENLIKVLFNSTLRQSQLIEQLSIADRPSLFLNVLFILSFSTYLTLLDSYFTASDVNFITFSHILLFVFLVYSVKSLAIWILGRISNFEKAAKDYLFILWIVNKTIGFICIPFICMLAYFDRSQLSTISWVSIFLIMPLFLFRYFQIYSRVRYQLDISKTHFILYIISMEIIPMLILCKCFAEFIIKKQ